MRTNRALHELDSNIAKKFPGDPLIIIKPLIVKKYIWKLQSNKYLKTIELVVWEF
jgi:poly(3-hydroxyalkanoate) synthetase